MKRGDRLQIVPALAQRSRAHREREPPCDAVCVELWEDYLERASRIPSETDRP